MNDDVPGASLRDRATHEPSPAVSALRVSVPSADPYFAELREMLLASVGGYDQFERSFNWRTFSPKKRAESSLSDAINMLEAAMAELHEAGIEPDLQRVWLASAIKKWAAYQHAGARTSNWMITGPARFPVARNEKAMRVEAKRGDEFLAFAAGAAGWAARQKRVAARKEVVAADAQSGEQHKEKLYGDVRVVLNKALDRVQIIFPGKPSDDERRVLKSRAFRWAPSVGAWQRQLTQNGVWAAQAAMKDLGLSAQGIVTEGGDANAAPVPQGLEPGGDSHAPETPSHQDNPNVQ